MSTTAADRLTQRTDPHSTGSRFNPMAPSAPRGSVVRLIVALIVGVLATGIVAGVVGSRGERFQSQAVLSIDQPLAIANSADAGVVEKLSQLRGKYAGLVRTNVIAEPVADAVDLPVARVRRALSASAEASSLLLIVRAQDADATVARSIADAAADEIATYADGEQADVGIKAEQRYGFELVVPAGDGAKIAPTRTRALQAGTLAGVLAALGLYLALQVIAVQRKA